jgi:hypothetical protein
MTKESDLDTLKTDLEIMETNAAKGYWVNNTYVRFKNAIKPCKLCGFCPYGQLVEDFPLPSISRQEAIEHHNYMVKALADGTFDKPDPDFPLLMSRECAEIEIGEFDEENYPEDPIRPDKMGCSVFGHHCPVFYHAELFGEEEELTDDERKAFTDECREYLDRLSKEDPEEEDDE